MYPVVAEAQRGLAIDEDVRRSRGGWTHAVMMRTGTAAVGIHVRARLIANSANVGHVSSRGLDSAVHRRNLARSIHLHCVVRVRITSTRPGATRSGRADEAATGARPGRTPAA